MDELNETHDAHAVSWVSSANEPDADFPIQNLPFGVFRTRGPNDEDHIGVAIGREVLDLASCDREGLLHGLARETADACRRPTLNGLLALGPEHWSALRRRLSGLLRANHPDSARHRAVVGGCLRPLADVDLLRPIAVGDYTDFYASLHHATNVGRMLRPDQPLLPNYKYVPIGYHGRASSIVVSGTPVQRPCGQTKSEGQSTPSYGPSRRLDYELELGLVIGGGNDRGTVIPLAEAERHLFGVCLLNDWSARDVQQWEYQPLGPFLAKSFATSVSPWVVTLEALQPFRAPLAPRAPDDPEPLPYLRDAGDAAHGGIDALLEVWFDTARMRAEGHAMVRLSRSAATDLYWTPGQLIAHHTSNGCNLRPGDLLATGTVSGPTPDSRGCLLELTWRGSEPFVLPTGEQRRFLEDGDRVVLRGRCARPGAVSIGFGSCEGTIVASPTS